MYFYLLFSPFFFTLLFPPFFFPPFLFTVLFPLSNIHLFTVHFSNYPDESQCPVNTKFVITSRGIRCRFFTGYIGAASLKPEYLINLHKFITTRVKNADHTGNEGGWGYPHFFLFHQFL